MHWAFLSQSRNCRCVLYVVVMQALNFARIEFVRPRSVPSSGSGAASCWLKHKTCHGHITQLNKGVESRPALPLVPRQGPSTRLDTQTQFLGGKVRVKYCILLVV